MAEFGALVPKVMTLVEDNLDVNALKGDTVAQMLAKLASKADAKDQATIEQARHALELMPVIKDLPFEELYLHDGEVSRCECATHFRSASHICHDKVNKSHRFDNSNVVKESHAQVDSEVRSNCGLEAK